MMNSNVQIFLLSCGVALQTSLAFPDFAQTIPNGMSVPNPGPQGGIWAGVGHVNAGGGGERNPFGQDFAAQGFQWTEALCETDSDGDGRTNGVELGDPTCEWFVGGPDPTGPTLSHPGIPDEPNEEAVKASCADYIEPEEFINLDITFTEPSVMDETQTHYICEQKYIEVSHLDLLHNIKYSVLLDNSDVLHHMFIHVCPDGSTDGDRVGEGQYACSGTEARCRRVAGWAIGPHDTCLPNNVGSELNLVDTDKLLVKIEAHYDNASGETQQDQSGMRLVLTPELRPLKGTTTILGMATMDNNFAIPAQLPSYPLTNICPTEATMKLKNPIFVYQFTPHMHQHGQQLYTEHYRCGVKIGEIGRIDSYEFDNQQSYGIAKPIKVLPGDALVTTCTFDSLDSDLTIIGGEETANEMCFNFLSYYPKQEDENDGSTILPNCFSFENGIPAANEFRFAVTGTTVADVVRSFDSDPTNNFAPCCATNSCEQMYLTELGGACGIDDDCVDELKCAGGLCAVASTTSSPTESPVVATLAESPVGTTTPTSSSLRQGYATLLFAVLMGLLG